MSYIFNYTCRATFVVRLVIWLFCLFYAITVESEERKHGTDNVEYLESSVSKGKGKNKICLRSKNVYHPYKRGGSKSDQSKLHDKRQSISHYIYEKNENSSEKECNNISKYTRVESSEYPLQNNESSKEKYLSNNNSDSTIIEEGEINTGNTRDMEFWDNPIYDALIEEVLRNDYRLLSVTSVNKILIYIFDEEDKLLTDSTMNGAFVENQTIVNNLQNEKVTKNIPKKKDSCFSRHIERTISFGKEMYEQEDKMHEEKEKDIIYEENEEENAHTNEEIVRSLSFSNSQETNDLIKSNHICIFMSVMRNLNSINEMIQETNTNEVIKIDECFKKLKEYDMDLFKYVRCEVTATKANKYGKCINKISHLLKKSDELLSYFQIEYDITSFFDTITFLEIYLQLLSNYSMINVSSLMHNLRKYYNDKKKELEEYPEDIKHLTLSINEIEDILTKLPVYIRKKHAFYKLRYFHKLVLQIYDKNVETMDNSFVPYLTNLMNVIPTVLKAIEIFRETTYTKGNEKVYHIMKKYNEYKIKDFIYSIKNLLSRIMQKEEALKKKIKITLKEPEVVSYYIYHHLSVLLFQRLLNINKNMKERQYCVNIYKEFLEAFSLFFSKTMKYKDFNELSQKNQYIISNNDAVLDYMFSYANFQIVKIILMDIEKKQMEFIQLLMSYSSNNIIYLKRKDYLKGLKLLLNSIDSIKILNEWLYLLHIYRVSEERLMSIFALEENINTRIHHLNNIIYHLIYEEKYNVQNKNYKKFQIEYKNVRSLFTTLFDTVQKPIY